MAVDRNEWPPQRSYTRADLAGVVPATRRCSEPTPSTPRILETVTGLGYRLNVCAGSPPGDLPDAVRHVHDAGCASGENQDRVGADPRRGTFIVADGMGGLADGGSTAQTVVDQLPGRQQAHRVGRGRGQGGAVQLGYREVERSTASQHVSNAERGNTQGAQLVTFLGQSPC